MKSITSRYVFLTFAVFLLSISFSCNSTQKTTEAAPPASMDQITISFSGMGGYIEHQITQNQMISSVKGRGQATADVQTAVSDQDWNKLNELISKLDLNKFDTWEGPTQKRFHDGARATVITIESNGKTYTSQAFDEGNPPAELNDLYQYLATMTKS